MTKTNSLSGFEMTVDLARVKIDQTQIDISNARKDLSAAKELFEQQLRANEDPLETENRIEGLEKAIRRLEGRLVAHQKELADAQLELDDARRLSDLEALRKALPNDEKLAVEITAQFERKVSELGEILARGVAHFAAHSDRASRLEKLSPQDRHGWAVQCAWNRSDGCDQLHEALGRIRKQLEDVAYQEDRKVWITSVDIPVLMEK